MRRYPIPAVIFAGGKSSRMGQDKALLPFGGYPTLSEFQYDKLTRYFARVYLSARSDKFTFTAPILYDRYPDSSPLVGIISLFEHLPTIDEVFVLSVDAPFVGQEVIDAIMAVEGAYDAIIAKSPHGIQPLCGRYRRTLLPHAKAQLHANQHKLTTLLTQSHTHFVPYESQEYFTNLNYPEEYTEALRAVSVP